MTRNVLDAFAAAKTLDSGAFGVPKPPTKEEAQKIGAQRNDARLVRQQFKAESIDNG